MYTLGCVKIVRTFDIKTFRLLTRSPVYSSTYLLTYLTCPLTYLLTHLLNLSTHLLTYSPTYLSTHIRTFSPTYLPTHLLTYSPYYFHNYFVIIILTDNFEHQHFIQPIWPRTDWNWYVVILFNVQIGSERIHEMLRGMDRTWLYFTWVSQHKYTEPILNIYTGPPRGGGRGGKIPGARRLLGARQGPAGPGRAPNVNIVNIIWARDCSIWGGPWRLCPGARVFSRWPCIYILNIRVFHENFFCQIRMHSCLFCEKWHQNEVCKI